MIGACDVIADRLRRVAAQKRRARVMHTRQNGEGGFGVWTSTPESVRYVSVYAMQFLIEASHRGQKLPGDMSAAGARYLKQLAADGVISE